MYSAAAWPGDDERAHREQVGLDAEATQHQVDEVGGAHLGVAGHVPRRAPAQGPGQRVGEAVDAADQRGQRALVEPDLGVGEVAVVEQHQVGLPLADQLGDVGVVARHVDLDAASGAPARRR